MSNDLVEACQKIWFTYLASFKEMNEANIKEIDPHEFSSVEKHAGISKRLQGILEGGFRFVEEHIVQESDPTHWSISVITDRHDFDVNRENYESLTISLDDEKSAENVFEYISRIDHLADGNDVFSVELTILEEVVIDGKICFGDTEKLKGLLSDLHDYFPSCCP